MNRVILGEASIISSSGFGKEERKGKKKFHFSLCTEMKVVTMIALDSGIIHDFFFSFLLYVFPPEIIFLIFMYYTFINDINKKLKNINIKARDLLLKKMVLEGNRMKRTHKIY